MHPFVAHYTQVTVPRLQEANDYPSTFMVPKVSKVVINCGIGDVLADGKDVEAVAAILSKITGQKPVTTKARKAVSGFKIRQGMDVAMKVTLRDRRMNDFLIKLIEIVLPRTRDFRGLKSTGITADGNLNIGIRDSMIFPEASDENRSHGLQVTIVSSARTLEQSRALYESLGFVFQSEEEAASQPKKTRTRKRF